MSLLKKQGLLPSFENLHGELKNFEDCPRRGLIREHFNHLHFLEFVFNDTRLKILDLCCGSGDFTFIAKQRGHTCVATDTQFINKPLPQMQYFDFINLIRHQRRVLYQIDNQEVFIKAREPILLSFGEFDVIYINQAVFHFPNEAQNTDPWSEDDWWFFINEIMAYVKPKGFIFLTLANHCYKQLPPLFGHFYIDYSHLFAGWEDAWWPTALI